MAVQDKEYICHPCQVAYVEGGPNVVGCDSCDNWFHWDCVGFTKEDDLKNEPWFCSNCIAGMNNHNINTTRDEPMADSETDRILLLADSNGLAVDDVSGDDNNVSFNRKGLFVYFYIIYIKIFRT